jgi:hypothetical protein
MSESLDRRSLPPDNPEQQKAREAQKEADRYLKLARENPHAISDEIKKNPKTEPFLRKLLWNTEYEGVQSLNPNTLKEDTDIAKMQKEIYTFVDINPDTDRNSTKNKFLKGLIDSIIVENVELTKQIIETRGKIFLDMISHIFSWEWLKQIAEWLKTSVMGIFSGDAYKAWKSTWELGLITTGAWLGVALWKKWLKEVLRVTGKESVWELSSSVAEWVQSRVRKIVSEASIPVSVATKRIDNIPAREMQKAPKHIEKQVPVFDEIRYAKLEAEGKLIPKDKLDLHLYPKEIIPALKSRLWLPESATMQDIEKAYRFKAHEVLQRYETLGKQNLGNIWQEILESLKKQWIENPEALIWSEITKVQAEYMRWEIFVVRVDNRLPNEVTNSLVLSKYQLTIKNDEGKIVPFPMPKLYQKAREIGDKNIWTYWLDAKYSTFVANAKELQKVASVYQAKSVSIVHPETLKWRAGMTYYDSILFPSSSADVSKHMIRLDDIFIARALKNIEIWYNVGKFERLQKEAIWVSKGGMRKMYEEMPNMLEVQIFGEMKSWKTVSVQELQNTLTPNK